MVLARDEHGDPVGGAVDLVDGQQQRAARHVEPARELAVGVVRREPGDAVGDGEIALRERRVDRARGQRAEHLRREVLDPAPVADVDHPAPVRRAHAAQAAHGLALRQPERLGDGARRGHGARGLLHAARLHPGRADQGRDAEVAPEVVRQRRPVRHVGARAVPARDEAVLLEHRDGRPHRGARDRPPPGQLRLGRDPVARPPLARGDPRPQLVGEAVAQRAARRPHGATTTLSASPARMRGNASGVSSSPITSETTERMPPVSAASMSSAATWSRWRDA